MTPTAAQTAFFGIALLLSCLSVGGCGSTEEAPQPAPPTPPPTEAAGQAEAPVAAPPGGPGPAPDGSLPPPQEIKPQQTQEQLEAGGSFVTLSGTVAGKGCTGAVRIDVLDSEVKMGAPAAGSTPIMPLTTIDLEKVGAFTGKVPKGKKVLLSALCDVNKDGLINPPTDLMAHAEDPIDTSKDVKGVLLDFSVAPKMPDMGSAGGPQPPMPGGEGQAPPPGGAPAGAPPAGAPPQPGAAPAATPAKP